MVNYNQTINNYKRLNNKSFLNVKPRRKTLKINNNKNNKNMPQPTYRNNQEYKVAFPPTHIRDWTYEYKPILDVAHTPIGWMGSNNETRNNAGKGSSSVAHDLQALPVDPLQPEPVPLKDLQPMNNNKGTRNTRSNTIFAHNLRGIAPTAPHRVPLYARSTAASRARVKATDAPGRQKAMAEHYKKIGLTRRNKKSRRHK